MVQKTRLNSQEYAVPHPGNPESDEIELAIFKDHRYSFYYWLKWSRDPNNSPEIPPPTLVTIDWHRDLAPPSEDNRKTLERVGTAGLDTVARFTESELDYHNDAQVLSAAWLNLIGDIVLLKNYGMDQEKSFTGRDGRVHHILEFENYGKFRDVILERTDPRVYLDVDLDYFIKNKVAPHQRKDVQLYTDDEIGEVIDPDSELFGCLFDRMVGITIATEPRYCGGIRNSNHLLEVILDRLFTFDMKWKHLR